jgi:hypothetical protein
MKHFVKEILSILRFLWQLVIEGRGEEFFIPQTPTWEGNNWFENQDPLGFD